MKRLFKMLVPVIALFMLCSCNGEDNSIPDASCTTPTSCTANNTQYGFCTALDGRSCVNYVGSYYSNGVAEEECDGEYTASGSCPGSGAVGICRGLQSTNVETIIYYFAPFTTETARAVCTGSFRCALFCEYTG